jgi:hypothetical protein
LILYGIYFLQERLLSVILFSFQFNSLTLQHDFCFGGQVLRQLVDVAFAAVIEMVVPWGGVSGHGQRVPLEELMHGPLHTR